MDVNIGRLKKWDFGVGIAFLVTFIANFIPWWKLKMGDLFGGLEGLVGADVPGLDTSVWGWDFGAGRAAFCFALFAVLFALAKAFLPAGKALPKWYAESWVILVFGGIVTLCGLIGAADAPGGGYSAWSWRPGGLITLVAGVGILYCGYMMLRDKSGDYGDAAVPKINIVGAGGQTPPAGGASKFCVGCGTPVDPGAAACKSCGRPV
jgi:hypothetical protein